MNTDNEESQWLTVRESLNHFKSVYLTDCEANQSHSTNLKKYVYINCMVINLLVLSQLIVSLCLISKSWSVSKKKLTQTNYEVCTK